MSLQRIAWLQLKISEYVIFLPKWRPKFEIFQKTFIEDIPVLLFNTFNLIFRLKLKKNVPAILPLNKLLNYHINISKDPFGAIPSILTINFYSYTNTISPTTGDIATLSD